MAVYLDAQAIYVRRKPLHVSLRLQAFVAALLLVTLAAKVWIKVEITDVGYQIGHEQDRAVALDMERRELELERSVLLRPDVLSRAAKSRLGMQPMNPSQVLSLGASDVHKPAENSSYGR